MKELKEFTVERLTKIANSPFYYAGCEINEIQALAKIALAAKQAKPSINAGFKDGWPIPELLAVIQGSGKLADGFHDLYTTPPLNHTEQDGWIKCSNQLPPNDDFVLIWPTPDFGVDLHVGQYMKYHKKGTGWFAQVNEQNYGIEWHPIAVTHWMKLPAAPKPEV